MATSASGRVEKRVVEIEKRLQRWSARGLVCPLTAAYCFAHAPTKKMASAISGKRVARIGVIVLGLAASPPVRAQYTANFQTNTISNVTSNWSGDYIVGSNTYADVLLIQNSGILSNRDGYLGYQVSSSNNSVWVTGTGSVWNIGTNRLYVGYYGPANSLVISNGGQVVDVYGDVSGQTSSSNNTVLVTGTNSAWRTSGLDFGNFGSSNRLVISNGGQVVDNYGGLGGQTSSSNNYVLVTDNGSVWSNGYEVHVGYYGSGNSLVISNAGKVFASSGSMGDGTLSSDNAVLVTGSGSVWSNNSLYIGSYGSGNSLVISNAGQVVNDTGDVGLNSSSSNNTVLVSGTGSVWNTGSVSVGYNGSGNGLVINNGGRVNNYDGFVGDWTTSRNNAVLVTGIGSVWSNSDRLLVGSSGSGNSLVISNGGQVVDSIGFVGYDSSSSNNSLRVADGAVWSNKVLFVGYQGSSNLLAVAGGSVFATNLTVGFDSASSNNLVQLDSGSLIVTNGSGTGIVVVDGGSLIVGAGTFKTDNLVVTNAGAVQYTQTYQVENATVAIASGAVQASSNFVVASAASSTGTINITGGQLVVTNGVVGIGNNGTLTGGAGVGSMTVSNGTLVASTILLGSSAGGQGTLILAAGGLIRSARSNSALVVNDFSQRAGVVGLTNIDDTLYCGYVHPGAYTLSDGDCSCYDVYVGYDDAGTMTIAGGTMNILSRLTIGHLGSPVSTGVVWITGGQLSMTNDYCIIGSSGVGQFTTSNGTVTATDMIVGNGGNPGTLTVAGGAMTVLSGLTVGDCGGSTTGFVTITDGNLFVTNAAHNATLDARGGRLTLTGGQLRVDRLVMTNSCGLFVRGGGTLIVTSLVLDPNRDADGDGLLNSWEQSHGLDPLNAADANADPDGDGLSNLREYQLGTDPATPWSPYRITAVARESDNVRITWATVGGTTNVVQFTAGRAGGSYSNNFADLDPQLIIAGSTVTSTNYLVSGGATNIPSRYYRIRVLP